MTRNCAHCSKPNAKNAAKCAHCGRALKRVEPRLAHHPIACPRCGSATDVVTLAAVELDLCRSCRGLWFDRSELQQFGAAVSDEELNAQMVALLKELERRASQPPQAAYLGCPLCGQQMVRNNFERVSGVILHGCAQHGTWADHQAARRVVELMSGDGVSELRSRAARVQEHETSKRLARLETAQANYEVRLEGLESRARIHLILDVLGFL